MGFLAAIIAFRGGQKQRDGSCESVAGGKTQHTPGLYERRRISGFAGKVLCRRWALRKIEPKSVLGRPWSEPGEPKIDEKSRKIALGAILGRSWRALERSWRALGRSWRTLGGLLGHLGALLGDLGALLEPPGRSQNVSEGARDEFFARSMRKSHAKGLQSDFRATLR